MQKIVVKSKVIEKVEIWHSMIAFVVLGMDRIEVSVVLNMFEIWRYWCLSLWVSLYSNWHKICVIMMTTINYKMSQFSTNLALRSSSSSTTVWIERHVQVVWLDLLVWCGLIIWRWVSVYVKHLMISWIFDSEIDRW